jgi:hypothetical protein
MERLSYLSVILEYNRLVYYNGGKNHVKGGVAYGETNMGKFISDVFLENVRK